MLQEKGWVCLQHETQGQLRWEKEPGSEKKQEGREKEVETGGRILDEAGLGEEKNWTA